MYKPYTVEQYHVYRFLKENFALKHFLVSPVSRTTLLLKDKAGEEMAFAFLNGQVQEVPLPSPPDPDAVKAFVTWFRQLTPRPALYTFEEITKWWLDHPNPLTYQQALGLPDDLYHRFLSSDLLDDEAVIRLVEKGLVSMESYQDIRLWYFNGNYASCWLGPLGLDGTGNIYGLTLRYRKPDAREMEFYLLDDYYRCMNHIL